MCVREFTVHMLLLLIMDTLIDDHLHYSGRSSEEEKLGPEDSGGKSKINRLKLTYFTGILLRGRF